MNRDEAKRMPGKAINMTPDVIDEIFDWIEEQEKQAEAAVAQERSHEPG